jgi:hypothetical protein
MQQIELRRRAVSRRRRHRIGLEEGWDACIPKLRRSSNTARKFFSGRPRNVPPEFEGCVAGDKRGAKSRGSAGSDDDDLELLLFGGYDGFRDR